MKIFVKVPVYLIMLLMAFFTCSTPLAAQQLFYLTNEDKTALEGIIVEKYYIADSVDCADTTGGVLPVGSVTYRIYVDLKKGYVLQDAFGVDTHPLLIETSTSFFNNKEGAKSGDKIDSRKINNHTLAFDSWLTIASVTHEHFGILKSEDKDGSVIKRKSLEAADGLTLNYKTQGVILFGADFSFVDNNANTNRFYTEDGAWAVLGGARGTTDENRILLAQLTTDGKLTFELNIQVGTPSGTAVQFVAKNPLENEILFNGLIYK